ncbi:hypothetical protein D3C73_1221860 [compost metagenome]
MLSFLSVAVPLSVTVLLLLVSGIRSKVSTGPPTLNVIVLVITAELLPRLLVALKVKMLSPSLSVTLLLNEP